MNSDNATPADRHASDDNPPQSSRSAQAKPAPKSGDAPKHASDAARRGDALPAKNQSERSPKQENL
jgi:hypothetical protein